jgi:uncharacterized protein involved in outer membrane biogenesis
VRLRTKLIGIFIPVVVCAVIGCGLWYVRTSDFQNYVRSMLLSKMEAATGLSCSMQSMTLDVYHGQFVIRGLALTSKTSASEPASVRVEEIRAKIGLSSLWHLRVRLMELTILHPRVHLKSGRESSSWDPAEILKALQISLRLEAARVAVEDGLIQINDRTQPFHLRMNELDCEVRYAKTLPSYKIHISYRRSQIYWKERDFRHDLDLTSNLSLQGLEIEHYQFRRGDTLFEGSGVLKNWHAPELQLQINGVWDARDLVLAQASLTEGKGNINVRLNLHSDQHGISVKGTFDSVNGKYRKMAYRHLGGNMEIKNDVLFFRDVRGRIAGGTIAIEGDLQLRKANKDPNRIVIHTKNVPIIDAGRLLNIPLMHFANPADMSTVLVWYGGKPLKVDCSAKIHGFSQEAAKTDKHLLLDGLIRFTYLEPGQVLVAFSDLYSPYSRLQISGGGSSPYHVRLSTTHIAEPMKIIAGYSPTVADLLKRYPDLQDMKGKYDFAGDVRIKTSEDVEYRGSLAIQNGRWRTYALDALSAQAEFVSSRLKLQAMTLGSGKQQAEGSLELKLAQGDQLSEFRFQGDLRQVDMSSLSDFGVDTSQMGGILNGTGMIFMKDGRWEGAGYISVEHGRFRNETFDSLRTQVKLANQKLHLQRSEVRRGSVRLTAEGDVDLISGVMNIPFRIQGLALEDLPVVKDKRLPIQGRLNASGTAKGTVENPDFAGDFDLQALRYDRWDLGQGKGRIDWHDGSIHGTMGIRSELGRWTVQADISSSMGFPGKISLDVADLNAQKIVPANTPSYLKELSTDLYGKAEIQGRFADMSTIEMHGEIGGAHFRIQDYALHNAGNIHIAWANQRFRIENARFDGDGTSLLLTGTFPLDESSQLDLALNGQMNLRLLEGIQNTAQINGTAVLNLRATGSKKNPQIIGRASFQNSKLDADGLPSRLSSMQGDVVFSRNVVRLENIRGSMASGTIQLSGAIEHENTKFRSMNLSIALRNARLQIPKDFKSLVDADLVLSGTPDAQILGGDVHVLRMEYMRSFNLLEQIAGRSSIQSGPLTTDPFLLGLRLNLEIHTDNGLYIDNELARLRGSYRLALRGTPAYPSLTGRVEATEGDIFFRGSRFAITRAAANFIDRTRINPVLEIRAEADVKTYRLILDAMGDLEHLSLTITSDPVMSMVDIISLLTTGKSDISSDTNSNAVSSQRESERAGISAASVLSENLTGVLGKRVQRIFGLESFRVDPFLAGAENDPTARLTISERISKDLVVTYSRNLTTSREQIVVIEYDIGRDLSMVATRDENGKFGLDFRFRKRWR